MIVSLPIDLLSAHHHLFITRTACSENPRRSRSAVASAHGPVPYQTGRGGAEEGIQAGDQGLQGLSNWAVVDLPSSPLYVILAS